MSSDKLAQSQKSQNKIPKKIAKFSPTRFADSGRVFTRQYELSTEIWNIWDDLIRNMTMKQENLPSRPTVVEWNIILGLRYFYFYFYVEIYLFLFVIIIRRTGKILYLQLIYSYILNVFKGSINLIEGELYPTSPWLLDAISCIHAICRNDGQMLNSIVKNDHDVELSNNNKIKKSCQFVDQKIKEV